MEARRLRRQQRLLWAEVAAAQPELQVVVAPTLLRVIAQQAAQHLDHRQRQARLTDQRRVGALADLRLDQLVLAQPWYRVATAEQHQDTHAEGVVVVDRKSDVWGKGV